MPTGQQLENQFLPTLGQALHFRALVGQSQRLWDKQCFATATTFFCAAATEAAANGLLQLVAVSSKLEDLIDRFPVLEKVDIVASGKGKQLDRGAKPSQDIRDLLRRRNEIVHPKITARDVEYETIPGDDHFAKYHIAKGSIQADGSVEQLAADSAVQSTIAFLDYVVVDLLELDQGNAEFCLIGYAPTSERRAAYHIDSLRALLQYQASSKPIRFLKLPSIPGEAAA